MSAHTQKAESAQFCTCAETNATGATSWGYRCPACVADETESDYTVMVAWRLVGCPSCGVAEFEDCLNDTGQPVIWCHQSRYDAAPRKHRTMGETA